VRFAAWLLVLLAAVTLFAGLGRPAISDSDEAFYAEAGREMVTGGDWLTPHFNYENRFQKPILFYWIVASCYAVAGIDEAAARVGSAAAGLGIVLLVFAAGRRWYDDATGLLAGAITATSFGCASAARLSLPDLPLAFFITLTVWAAFVALFDRPRSATPPGASRARVEGRRARSWWLLAGFAAALGFLTKGPLALAVPVLALAVPFVLERGWRRLHPADAAMAAGVFLVVATPWYAAMTSAHGASYLRGFFIGDNLERFATTAFNAPRPIYFYVPIVLAGMLPWTPFFALLARPVARGIRLRKLPLKTDVRLWCWAAAPFLLFTISIGKQPRYVLPMLAPLALLLAVVMRRAAASLPPPLAPSASPEQRLGTLPDPQPRLFRWMAALSGAIVALVGVLLWRATPLLSALRPGHVVAGIAALVTAGVLVVAVAASRAWRRVPVAIAIAAVAFILVMRYVIVDLPDLDPVEFMAGRVLAHRSAGERVASYRVFVRNLIFYTHVKQDTLYVEDDLVKFLDTPDRVLCVLRADDLRRLEETARRPGAGRLAAVMPGVKRLDTITYFDPATAKIGALISPDPAKDQQTAVLVSNR
jgi:4-amino-4-deoxy-L-arabinose transferase-like glycosyltransferase